MKPEVEEIRGIKIVGVKGKCNMATTMQDIPPLWKKLMENEGKISNRVNPNVAYGVYIMIDKESCWAIAGFEVSEVEDIPEGMMSEDVAAMKVAKFIHKGKSEDLKDTYGKIMGEWLPASGLEYDYSKPCIEMYDERFKEESDESICEIWMAVK